jgi:hypothetical protein
MARLGRFTVSVDHDLMGELKALERHVEGMR